MLKKLRFLTALPVLLGGVCDELQCICDKIKEFNKYLNQVTDFCTGLNMKSYEKNFISTNIYSRYYKYVACGIPPHEIKERLKNDFGIGEPILNSLLKNKRHLDSYTRFAQKYTINALKKAKFTNKQIAMILNMAENSVYRLNREEKDKEIMYLHNSYKENPMHKYFLNEFNKDADELEKQAQ